MTAVLTTVTAVAAALLGGLFLAFSTAVMPGLHRRPPAEAAGAMQAINRAIVNPVFGTLFVGTALVALATAVLAALQGSWPVVAGAVVTVVGAHVVTVAVNIPLNTALDGAQADATAWERFEGPWNRAHTVRTLLTVAGAVLLVV
ncbi:anthrone oxygenase family protein [Pseudonocardia pini]|uniref:anthrone oxygenase family protein n=1 Tax=Pseudonocardia pini TaxID=2758030 RepID=UPI0015EFFE2B|nr:anthrone oxygenase family protein [Pseudonocardia pini]